MGRVSPRLLSLMVVVALCPALAARPAKLGKPVADPAGGYMMRLVEKFTPLPVKPDEVMVLRRYSGPEYVHDWTQYNASLEIVFVPKPKPEEEAKAGETVTSSEEDEIRKAMEEFGRKEIATAWDWLNSVYINPAKTGQSFPAKIETKLTPAGEDKPKKGKIDAQWYTFTLDTYQSVGAIMGLALIVPTEAGEYGVFYTHHSGKFIDFQEAFKASVNSFMLIDRQGGTLADLDAAYDEYSGDAFRKARKATITEGWKSIDTDNYLIIYHCDDKLAKKIAGRLEACRLLYERMFPPKETRKAVSVVRVCADRDEYHQYGGPGGSAGYWSQWDKELVLYEDTEGGKRNTFSVLHHEAFHQFIYYYYGEISPHSWYNEGHGDYFAGIKFDEKHRPIDADKFMWRTDIAREAYQSRKLVPLADFIRYTQQQYYAQPDLCYAQGWALVFFLRESKKLEPAWRNILSTYMDAIWEESTRRKAERAAKEAERERERGEPVEPPAPGGEPGGEPGGAPGDGTPPAPPAPPGPGEGESPEGDEEEDPWLNQFGDEDAEVLAVALDKAFAGIDLAKLEAAFHEFIGNGFKDK